MKGFVFNEEVNPGNINIVIPKELITELGAYFLHVATEDGFVVKKFMVVK